MNELSGIEDAYGEIVFTIMNDAPELDAFLQSVVPGWHNLLSKCCEKCEKEESVSVSEPEPEIMTRADLLEF